MGSWGAGLYDDDGAADLRDTIALVCKVPGDGDRLFDALAQVASPPPAGSGDESAFWLVVADQFEKRGLACTRVRQRALALIESGADLAACRRRDAGDAFLRQRAKVLDELAGRLRAPRPARPAKTPGRPPAMVLETGEVHAFPTMQRVALHPYRTPRDPAFAPDGWGALVVLDTGRMFDWLPWVALAALDVDPGREPTLADALAARLVPHLQTHGAGRYVPRPAHARLMGLERIGRVALDPVRVAPALSRWPVAQAIRCDWTIAYAGRSTESLPRGVVLSTLLRDPG